MTTAAAAGRLEQRNQCDAPLDNRKECGKHDALMARIAAVLIVCLVLAGCHQDRAAPAPTPRLSVALLPQWDAAGCEPPNERESRIFDTAARAIELDDDTVSNWLSSGAQRLLGFGLLHTRKEKVVRVCTPRAVLLRVGAATAQPKGLGAGRLVDDQLQLAAQLPNAGDRVIEQVASVAFSDLPQPSEAFADEDIRPMARSALASFRQRAGRFQQMAVAQMSADSALGTGAAQIAAATHAPGAPAAVVKLFRDQLASVPPGTAIPLAKRDRLRELAWAIYLGGDPDRAGAAAIDELMARKVDSRAPPFGVVAIDPKRLCRVLGLVAGPAAVARHAYCLDPKAPYEQ